MQRRIATYDVFNWMSEFLGCLNDAKEEQEGLKISLLNEENAREIEGRYKTAEKRCILLDYDGTLSPIQKVPSMAAPTDELIVLLKRLTDDPANEVVVISGRDAETLELWLGRLPVNLIAEHGPAMKYKNGGWQEQASMASEWKEKIKPLMQLFVNRCAGSFMEEKKKHFSMALPQYASRPWI